MLDLLLNLVTWFIAIIPVCIGSLLLHMYIKADQEFRFWWALYGAILFIITGFYTLGEVI